MVHSLRNAGDWHSGHGKGNWVQAQKFFLPIALYLALWWMLVAADLSSLPFGLAAAAVAALLGLRFQPAGHRGLRPWRLAPLFGRFALHSLRGGIEVSWRALHPRLPIDPAWTGVRLASDHRAANWLLGGMVSLAPGSLATGSDGGSMDLHLLYAPGFNPREFERDQRAVLRLFGRRIENAGVSSE